MLHVGEVITPSLGLISRLHWNHPDFKYDFNAEFFIYTKCSFQRFDFIIHGCNKVFAASKKELFLYGQANYSVYNPEDLSLEERKHMFQEYYYNKEYIDG